MPPRTRTDHPSRVPQIENDLNDKYHVGWSYMTDVSPAAFDLKASLDNQARFEPISEETVEQYAAAVGRGDVFPAVIAYRPRKNGKLVIVDGNHRLVAHERHDAPLAVYEIEQGTRAAVIGLMTFAFNTKHGRPTSEAERISHAIWLVENRVSQEDAAAQMNVSLSALKRALSRAAADARADEVGLPRNEWDGLPQTSKARLLNVSTDEGFKDAAHLAYAARLNAEEVFELVSFVNTSRSAAKQRALVKSKAEEYRDKIQEGAGGVMGATNNRRAQGPRQRLAMALGQVFALPEDALAISKMYAAAEVPEARQQLLDAAERLKKIALAMPESVG